MMQQYFVGHEAGTVRAAGVVIDERIVVNSLDKKSAVFRAKC